MRELLQAMAAQLSVNTGLDVHYEAEGQGNWGDSFFLVNNEAVDFAVFGTAVDNTRPHQSLCAVRIEFADPEFLEKFEKVILECVSHHGLSPCMGCTYSKKRDDGREPV